VPNSAIIGPECNVKRPTFWRWLLLITITAAVIVIDQISKAYVAAHLDLHESGMPLDFLEPIFRFTHIHNTGAAFGIFPEGGIIFLVIAVIVSAVILYYYHQIHDRAYLTRLALGLQLGGALGNVVDRLRQGYVIDFFHLEHWPVFNIADSCIVIGVALLTLEMYREDRKQKQSLEKSNL
jgi:signal peptidase II